MTVLAALGGGLVATGVCAVGLASQRSRWLKQGCLLAAGVGVSLGALTGSPSAADATLGAGASTPAASSSSGASAPSPSLGRAAASAPPEPSGPILPADTGPRFLAALAPLELGGEIAPGYTLANVSISTQVIRVEVKGAGRAFFLVLRRATQQPGGLGSSKSFRVDLEPDVKLDGRERSAAVALVAALKRGDKGDFWQPGG